jgi:hypothetical protein
VNTNGSRLHGDGFTFFIGPVHFELPKNSSGGYLGLFNPETAHSGGTKGVAGGGHGHPQKIRNY